MNETKTGTTDVPSKLCTECGGSCSLPAEDLPDVCRKCEVLEKTAKGLCTAKGCTREPRGKLTNSRCWEHDEKKINIHRKQCRERNTRPTLKDIEILEQQLCSDGSGGDTES